MLASYSYLNLFGKSFSTAPKTLSKLHHCKFQINRVIIRISGSFHFPNGNLKRYSAWVIEIHMVAASPVHLFSNFIVRKFLYKMINLCSLQKINVKNKFWMIEKLGHLVYYVNLENLTDFKMLYNEFYTIWENI